MKITSLRVHTAISFGCTITVKKRRRARERKSSSFHGFQSYAKFTSSKQIELVLLQKKKKKKTNDDDEEEKREQKETRQRRVKSADYKSQQNSEQCKAKETHRGKKII